MNTLQTYLSSFPPSLYGNVAPTLPTATQQQPLQPQETKYRFPRISKQDFKATMDNYRLYVDGANKAIHKFNAYRKYYNEEVGNFSKSTPPPANTRKLLSLFIADNEHRRDAEYNEAAKSFNQLHGKYLKLRKLSTVKQATISVFEAILHSYKTQLDDLHLIWKNIGNDRLKPLPMVSVNPETLLKQERNGIQNINFCKRTLQNHKYRMEDAGIFVNRRFRGHKIAVEYHFNPAILVVSEAENKKTQPLQNQPTTPKRTQVLRNIQSVSTRAIIDKSENKGNVEKSNSRDKEIATQSPKNLFYKATKRQDVEENSPGAAEKVKVSAIKGCRAIGELIPAQLKPQKTEGPAATQKTKAQQYVEKLVTKEELAKRLANSDYLYYSPLKTEVLQHELTKSNLTNLEFYTVALQDFIKTSSQIYTYHQQPSRGMWFLNIGFIEKDFGCLNFAGQPFSKQEIFEKWKEFRYRIAKALDHFHKNQHWQPRFDYFDPAYASSKDVAWQYTRKWYRKKVKDAGRYHRKKEFQKAVSNLDQYIYAYLRNERSWQELERYVLGKSKKIQSVLPQRLQILTRNRIKK